MKNQIERAEPSRGAPDAIAKLRAARTAWHEDFGVPISQEYANFLTAVGEVEDGHVVLLEACKGLLEELRLIRMKDTNAVYDPTIRVRAEAAIQQAEQL